jgi:hypothetical protein
MRQMLALVLLAACSRSPREQAAADSAPQPAPIDSVIHPMMTENLRVERPGANSVITSPLTVSGQARGGWFFEASFPVLLLGPSGDTLAMKPAQAQGEWMTADFVPFTATLDFTAPPAEAGYGTLVLRKSNASGLPEHDEEFRIQVRFH